MAATLEQLGRELELRDLDFLANFSQRLFRKVDTGLLTQLEPAGLLALSELAYDFLSDATQDLNLRVFNPDKTRDGFELPYTIIMLALKDRPFIVDSVRAALERRDIASQYLLHPILKVKRGADGLELDEGEFEALELYFVTRQDEAKLSDLETGIRTVLKDVIAVTQDFEVLQAKALDLAKDLQNQAQDAKANAQEQSFEEKSEYAEFMRWLTQDNFVFLGYREYELVEHGGQEALSVVANSGLGLLAQEGKSTYAKPVALSELPDELLERVTGGRSLIVTKTNAVSSVHRPARMDYIGVKRYDESGTVRGERRLLGLFTSKALSAPTDEIPILRLRLQRILQQDGSVAGSHDYKAITSVYNSMPRDMLFGMSANALLEDIRLIVGLEQESQLRLTLRPDPLGRGLAVMVAMPRERFNAELRRKVQSYLKGELAASHVDYHLAMGEDETSLRFHFFFVTDKSHFDVNVGELERTVAKLSQGWDDYVGQALIGEHGDATGRELAERYLNAFDEGYKAEVAPATALRNIRILESLGAAAYEVDISNDALGEAGTSEHSLLQIYHQGRVLALSRVMPLLENLGFQVIEQLAFGVELADGLRGIDVFSVTDTRGQPVDVKAAGTRLTQALKNLLLGKAENDRLNALVLSANLSARQVALLRAYSGTYAQLNAVTSRSFIYSTLLTHPDLAGLIVDAFEVRFDPDFDGDREAELESLNSQFDQGLSEVSSLPEDTILRGLMNLVVASVRSNYFLDKPYISFKLDSAQVTTMPEPRPLYEIAVHGLNVEGVHLRGGKVARGGLRWSDRPDDYRTEVLGLMKTQMTKNAVIVPVGSKGGFVLKHAPSERGELLEFAKKQYQIYLRGLLDITDNLLDGEVVQPANLVIYDETDPYLVVAADKGTATFSDLANATAAEYDFWLGDAFASGGSRGYDHKKEGITARGAWECVSRHFQELGVNVHTDELSAVGIGDMSGDVFGNGLLYTDTLKLTAAFNHLHIFLDPDPDPKTSYAERQRLFDLPRSSWQDYDAKLISEGGGVFERSAKSIPLSPQIQAALGIEDDALSGQALIRAILTAPVDLLWNGGVGTYVKAAAETHAEAGDAANDMVRVDAEDLRAKVVGEGGNLGFTQLGRIAYALAGGRINTDAIDNSAGVDMSDHEVNLKIMLRPLTRSGELSEEKRNELLESMTDEVSVAVLRDNYFQSLALSVAEQKAQADALPFTVLKHDLARTTALKPALEYLPDAEALARRGRAGQSWTRPELAILLAYSKMKLYGELLAANLDQPFLRPLLHAYFPERLQTEYADAIDAHSLRREITATQLTNRLTDVLGLDFTTRISRVTGRGAAEVAEAAFVSLELLAADTLIAELIALDAKMDSSQYEAYIALAQAAEGISVWVLRQQATPAEVLEQHRAAFEQLRAEVGQTLAAPEKTRFRAAQTAWQEKGFGEELAATLSKLNYLPAVVNVLTLDADVVRSAKGFFAVGERLSLGWLREHLLRLPSTNKWDKLALGDLVNELRRLQTTLTASFLGGENVSLEAFLSRAEHELKTYDDACVELRQDEELSYTGAQVLTGYLRSLVRILSDSS